MGGFSQMPTRKTQRDAETPRETLRSASKAPGVAFSCLARRRAQGTKSWDETPGNLIMGVGGSEVGGEGGWEVGLGGWGGGRLGGWGGGRLGGRGGSPN